MKKIVLISCFLIIQIAGCSNSIQLSREEKAILDYDFYYEQTPGQSLSYKMMWDGYDNDNKFGPCVSYDNRLYTFLIEYREVKSEYNLVYLKNNLLEKCLSYLAEHENDNLIKTRFTQYSDTNTVDGKLLYAYKQLSNTYNDVVFKVADKLDDIAYSFDDYVLALAVRKKQLFNKQNVSSGKFVNKELTAFSRHILSFSNKKPELVSYDGKSDFDYIGDRLEVYPLGIETVSFLYYPRLGLINSEYQKTVHSNICIIDGESYLLLPRYILSDNGAIDLLDVSYSFVLYEDVYREYKKEFRSFVFCDDYFSTKNYSYSLFSYSKIANSIILDR